MLVVPDAPDAAPTPADARECARHGIALDDHPDVRRAPSCRLCEGPATGRIDETALHPWVLHRVDIDGQPAPVIGQSPRAGHGAAVEIHSYYSPPSTAHRLHRSDRPGPCARYESRCDGWRRMRPAPTPPRAGPRRADRFASARKNHDTERTAAQAGHARDSQAPDARTGPASPATLHRVWVASCRALMRAAQSAQCSLHKLQATGPANNVSRFHACISAMPSAGTIKSAIACVSPSVRGIAGSR